LVHRRQLGAIRWKKNNRSALRLMRISAAAEAAGDKHPVTPGGVVPMRELLGELLLRLDHPGPAFAEFERSLASLTGSAASMAQRSQPKLRTRAW
jgi:hypothetical protein